MEKEKDSEGGSPWEMRFGFTLAVLAALLAVNDLGGGKFGGDELQFANEKTSAYMWYQSKGIKETLAEGQRDLMTALLDGGAVAPAARAGIVARRDALAGDVTRYGREKKEILLGSKAVGPKGYAQDVGGEMGKVIGAKDYERAIEGLGTAGDRFDFANLFLQLSLVMGAIGIILRQERLKLGFYLGTLALGIVGLIVSVLAFRLALGVGL